MKSFLLWWTADHIQALKKLIVLAAGIAAYLLPQGSLAAQVALILAGGGITDSTLGSIWKLLQDKAAAKSEALGAKLAQSGAVRTLVAFLFLGAISIAAPARASGLDWSAGPTLPFLEFDVGNPHPVQVAPGVGVQVSITHDVLKREFLGKSWDVADLNLAAFGSVVSGASGQQFGTLSLAASLCTMSSLLCVGGGKHVLSSDQSFTRGGWFLLLSFSFNFALAPTSPPAGIESGAAGLPRANTLYLGRW